MSLKRDAVWTAADTFISSGLSFAFRLVVAHALSPYDFGVAALALTITVVLQTINDFGLTSALIQKDEEKVTPDLVNSTFTASLIVTIVLGTLTAFLIAPLSADFYDNPLIEQLVIVLAISLLPSPFSTVATALLYRQRRFKFMAINRCATTLMSLVVASVILWIQPSPWVIIWQSVSGAVFSTIGLLLATRWRFRLTLKKRHLREVFGFSGFVLANDIAVSLSTSAGVFILGRVVSVSDVGLFALASYLTDTARKSVMSILNRVVFVHWSQIKNNKQQLRDGYLSVVRWNCRAVFPVMTAFILFGPTLSVHFLGLEWQRLGGVLVWLSISVMIHASGGATSALYRAIGRPELDLGLFLATTLLLLLPGMFLGAWLDGLRGVAVATAVTKLVSVVIRQVMLSRIIGSTAAGVIRIVAYLLVLQLPMVAAWVIARLVTSSPYWIVDLAMLCIGFAIYGFLELPRAFPTLTQRLGLPALHLKWNSQ